MRPPGVTLAQHFYTYFENAQPQVKQEQELLEEVVFKSPFVTAKEIFDDVLPSLESNEFYSISYVGGQGNGKSTSAAEFVTEAEDAGYLGIYGKAEEMLIDLPQWIEKAKKLIKDHPEPKACIVLDDFSYSTGTVSAKVAAKFKHFVGDIRHVFEEKDERGKVIFHPKIFIIYISHRYHSVPPMLRNSPTWLFVTGEPEDKADAMKLIPRLKTERDKLEVMISFLSNVTSDGPKLKDLDFHFGDKTLHFRWGDSKDFGDGRLLMLIHHGTLKIFNARKSENHVDLEDYRIKYTPRPEPTPEEIEEKKNKEKEDFRLKAIKITEKLNNPKKSDEMEES